MRERLNRSKTLAKIISLLSNSLARQQGLMPVIGISVALLGFALLLVNVFIDTMILEFLGVLFQGSGILAALIGLLLTEPLGK